jgi:hypothetical protein
MRVLAVFAILLLLPACEAEPQQRPAPTALPKKICDDAQAAVDQATKSGALVLTSPVEAMIAQESWLPIPEAQRDGLTRAMGIVATCKGGAPKHEQEVVIRNETGMILTRRIIPTSFSMPGD